MSFRDAAHADLLEIMHDEEDGGHECTITSPAGLFEDFRVLSNDIHLSYDPGTGEAVTGRQSSVAVAISDLIAAGFEGIHGVADSSSKPWVIETEDVNGVQGTFKVVEHNPDNGAGLTLLFLEVYKPL